MPTTPFPLGMFTSNPNGNDAAAMAKYEAERVRFTAIMGAPPLLMNAFTDYSLGPADWPSNARWTAWSWKQSPTAAATIPVTTLPMSWNGAWGDGALAFAQTLVTGAYDAAYTGVINAWLALFPLTYFRLGYEMDGGFMPWFIGTTAISQAAWIAAFRHLAGLVRAAADSNADKVGMVVWNPAVINWTALSVADSYPGDDVVDVVGLDVYSPTYPLDRTDWSGGNASYPDDAAWAAVLANRQHFNRLQNASQWNPAGSTAGWSLTQGIALAKLHGKPLLICECGAGGDDAAKGPRDENALQPILAAALADAGVPILGVLIWATDQSDGNWGFLDGNTPLKAAAWAANFGAVLSPTASVAVNIHGNNGRTWTLTATTGQPVGTHYAGIELTTNIYVWWDPTGRLEVKADDPSQIAGATVSVSSIEVDLVNIKRLALVPGPVVATVTSRAGVATTLTFGGPQDFYAGSNPALPTNVYVYLAKGVLSISADDAGALPTIDLTTNGLAVNPVGFAHVTAR